MYRILSAEQPLRGRRNQLTHPHHTKPELVATAPDQTWSWDITRLLGPMRWTYIYLYVLLDIFSRYVVGWMVAERESSALVARLIEQSCLKQAIQPQQSAHRCRVHLPARVRQRLGELRPTLARPPAYSGAK